MQFVQSSYSVLVQQVLFALGGGREKGGGRKAGGRKGREGS